MLNIQRVKHKATSDTYLIKGYIAPHSDRDIANQCDRNNFGYTVLRREAGYMLMEVYTD